MSENKEKMKDIRAELDMRAALEKEKKQRKTSANKGKGFERKLITVNVPVELLEAFEKKCKEHYCSKNAKIVELIAEWVKE